jgi:hypothetical protein
LTEADRTAIAQMLESALNKLLHAPTARLKASAVDGGDADELASAVRVLFDLQDIATTAEAARGESATVAQDEDDERLAH